MKNKVQYVVVVFGAVVIMTIFTPAMSVVRNYIDVVGSSTVYPFATVVAEIHGKKTRSKTPKIESTGSGGGMKLFCSGRGINTPDITNASCRIKYSEFKKCQKKWGLKILLR